MDNKNVNQPLTKFQLNNEIKTSFELGQVVPFFWRDTVPGDVWRNSTNFQVRLMPLIAPVMHKLDLHAHFYFCPYRLLDKNFRDILAKPESNLVSKNLFDLGLSTDVAYLNQDNLLRSFGINSKDGKLTTDAMKLTSQYFLRAYHLVYNYYYKHELLDTSYIDDMTSDDLDAMGVDLLKIGYARHGLDYFMSSLPSTQYGSMVELDMDGNGKIRVDEMRLAEKLQYFKERLFTRARGRYKNFLDAFFGVSPTNMELQQPKYLGGSSQQLQVFDVDQTANYSVENDISPLGSQAGKVNSERYGYNFEYKSEEHGIILGLCYVLPRANYIGGIPREFIKPDFYSFYNPTFANLGMQETYGCELSAERKDTFGYNERYAELKYSKDVIAGDFVNLSSWHFGIDLRGEQLSKDFVHVKTDNQPFAVQSTAPIEETFGKLSSYHVYVFSDGHTGYAFFVRDEKDEPTDSTSVIAGLRTYIGNLDADAPYVYRLDNVDIEARNYGARFITVPSGSYPTYTRFTTLNLRLFDTDLKKTMLGTIDFIQVPFTVVPPISSVYQEVYFERPLADLSGIMEVENNGGFVTLPFASVAGNHVLLNGYNNCDALRPIPKVAKPSISL